MVRPDGEEEQMIVGRGVGWPVTRRGTSPERAVARTVGDGTAPGDVVERDDGAAIRFEPHPNGGGLVARSATVAPSAFVARTAWIDPGAVVRAGACVGAEVWVRDGAVVEEEAVLESRVTVGAGASVGRRALVGARTTLGRGSRVGELAVVERDSEVPAGGQAAGSRLSRGPLPG